VNITYTPIQQKQKARLKLLRYKISIHATRFWTSQSPSGTLRPHIPGVIAAAYQKQTHEHSFHD